MRRLGVEMPAASAILSASMTTGTATLRPTAPTRDGIAIPVLASIAGLLYLVNLTVSGYANTYYAMAAQAASQSWSALFFGALDGPGFITMDKPPLATVLMGLSVKAFGLNSWSILLPEALLGVGTVLILYLAVRRSFGSAAGLVAGLLMAVSPVAVLIFRYNNPDALLTFLLVSAAWALGRGIEDGRLRWALLSASLVGAAFLTKYLQAYVVLPCFALVWLACAPVTLRVRLVGLIAAALTVGIVSFWWVAIIEFIPAGSRPHIGGSTKDSTLDLLLGYDGLGRLFGQLPPGAGPGSPPGGPGGPPAGGPAGLTFAGRAGPLRLFNDQFAGQVAWLLPAAVVAIGVAIAVHARQARTDRRVAGYLLWGSWLAVHAAVFSLMSGTIHAYYAVILAPALAALIGGGATELWQWRTMSRWAGAALAIGVLVTGVNAWSILGRTPDVVPGIGAGALAVSVIAAVILVIPAHVMRPWTARAAIALASVAVLVGPLVYDLDTMATAYSGGDPIAGPAARFAVGPPGLGGPFDPVASRSFVDYLVANAGSARWIVAVMGTHVAADIQLAAGMPVMAMGGFTESDPAPTLDELRAAIEADELRFVLLRYLTVDAPNGVIILEFHGGPGGSGGPGISGERTSWVVANCAAVSIDGSTSAGLYDCAKP